MTPSHEDGLQWLERLAEQYEQTARTIRHTATLIRQAELANGGTHEHRHQGNTGGGDDSSVQIGEAIRRVLGGSPTPLKSGEIWRAIKTTKIALRTRSENPRALLDSTLASMERSGQIRRTERGPGSRWQLVT